MRASGPGCLFGERKKEREEKEIVVDDVELMEKLKEEEEREKKEEEYNGFVSEDGLFWKMLRLTAGERKDFLEKEGREEDAREVEEMFSDWLKREWFARGISAQEMYEIDRHATPDGGSYNYIRYYYPAALVDWVWQQYKAYKGC